MKIHVTEEDIKNGRPRQAMSCPIAHAIWRELQPHGVSVGSEYITIVQKKGSASWIGYNLSRAARRFIRRFDSGKPVEPFTFIAERRGKR